MCIYKRKTGRISHALYSKPRKPSETDLRCLYFLYIFFERGFTIESRAFPISTKARPVIAIIKPGGATHHQTPLAAAPAEFASCNIWPHVGMDGSPRPTKLRPASPKMAAGTEMAMLAKVNGKSCGIMCLKIILISD